MCIKSNILQMPMLQGSLPGEKQAYSAFGSGRVPKASRAQFPLPKGRQIGQEQQNRPENTEKIISPPEQNTETTIYLQLWLA